MEDAVLYNMLLDYKKNEQNVMGENFFLDVFIAFFLDFFPKIKNNKNPKLEGVRNQNLYLFGKN